MSWQVVYTDDAKQDLREIGAYIANVLLQPETGKRQVLRIVEATNALDHMPSRYTADEILNHN